MGKTGSGEACWAAQGEEGGEIRTEKPFSWWMEQGAWRACPGNRQGEKYGVGGEGKGAIMMGFPLPKSRAGVTLKVSRAMTRLD